uniref:Uncharacterized protein n=1 Tax=Rhizophora mucronata TaxID=61149 RepID=A0A2P2NW78_RHIMU
MGLWTREPIFLPSLKVTKHLHFSMSTKVPLCFVFWKITLKKKKNVCDSMND